MTDNQVTDEQLDQMADALLERMSMGQAEILILAGVAQNDTPAGFAAFFKLMHKTPLHSEGLRWVENAYKAHAEGRGLAQECHREAGKTTV